MAKARSPNRLPSMADETLPKCRHLEKNWKIILNPWEKNSENVRITTYLYAENHTKTFIYLYIFEWGWFRNLQRSIMKSDLFLVKDRNCFSTKTLLGFIYFVQCCFGLLNTYKWNIFKLENKYWSKETKSGEKVIFIDMPAPTVEDWACTFSWFK